MKRSFGKLLPASLAALVLASFAMPPTLMPPRLGAAAVEAVVVVAVVAVLAPQAPVAPPQAECAGRQQPG